MATTIKSQQEFYDIFKQEMQDRAPDLTDFSDGSKNDSIAGAASVAASEISKLIIDQFSKTYFDTAHGPEVTGGADDLEYLAVDHFGDAFERPEASPATGVVTFSRPNTNAGDVLIDVGTIVKTPTDANGQSQRFRTLLAVTMTGTSINASIEAVVPGANGNVEIGEISQIETALTDPSVVVTNSAATAGGEEEENDATYRETIRNLIQALAGATKAAIEAKAKTVPGVVVATAIEIEKVVIEWDIGTEMPIGDYFRIPYVTLYIADANGNASAALIAAVRAAVDLVRAAGVRVNIAAATASIVDWSANITLNPLGPNYAELVVDPTPIEETMKDYVNSLPVSSGFDVSDAEDAIMAIWGPLGTDDLTVFDTVTPSGDIAGVPATKLVPGDMEVVN